MRASGEDKEDTKPRLFPKGQRTRMWIAGCVLVALALIIWRAANVFLLFFLCVLLALVLRGVSDWSTRHLRIPHKWSLTVTVVVLLAVFAGTGWMLAPEFGDQFAKLREDLPRAVQRVEQHLNQYSLGRQLTVTVRGFTEPNNGASLLPKAARLLSSTLGVVGGIIVLLFVSVYLAADPNRYVNGLVHLFPPAKRERAREVFCVLGTTLQRQLVGQLSLMALNGVVTTIALLLLGVPLALSLGVLSALLNFIPNFGPIAAAVPAVLIAFLQSPQQALYVVILYLAYQNIDGYIFTPIVQKRTVSLPPALTIMAQVLLGVLLGTLGLLLAVPLAAAGLVLLKMLYVEDVFREKIPMPGEKSVSL